MSDPKGGEELFGPYADNWIETRMVKGKPLSPATKQGYRALMRRHLRPAFGGTKLRQITSNGSAHGTTSSRPSLRTKRPRRTDCCGPY